MQVLVAGRALPRHIAGLFTNRGNSPRPMCSVTHLVRTVLLFNELKCVDLLPRDPGSRWVGREGEFLNDYGEERLFVNTCRVPDAPN